MDAGTFCSKRSTGNGQPDHNSECLESSDCPSNLVCPGNGEATLPTTPPLLSNSSVFDQAAATMREVPATIMPVGFSCLNSGGGSPSCVEQDP